MKNSMGKSDLNSVHRIIDDTSIPEEMASCMVLATAMDVIMADVFSRIKAIYNAHGIEIRGNDVLKGLRNYCQAVKQAGYWFDREIEPRNVECTFGTYGTATAYDCFRARCGEVAEVVSMVVQASRNPTAMEKIRDTAREAACDLGITLDDWERLRLKTDY